MCMIRKYVALVDLFELPSSYLIHMYVFLLMLAMYSKGNVGNVFQKKYCLYKKKKKPFWHHAFASVHYCLVVTCWERAGVLALVCDAQLSHVVYWVRCGNRFN